MAWAMRAMQHAEVYYKVRCLSLLLSRIKHVIVLYGSLRITVLSKLNSCVLEIIFITVRSYPQRMGVEVNFVFIMRTCTSLPRVLLLTDKRAPGP